MATPKDFAKWLSDTPDHVVRLRELLNEAWARKVIPPAVYSADAPDAVAKVARQYLCSMADRCSEELAKAEVLHG